MKKQVQRPMVTYRHRNAKPNETYRFRQFADHKLPEWAVDVQLERGRSKTEEKTMLLEKCKAQGLDFGSGFKCTINLKNLRIIGGMIDRLQEIGIEG
jgi:hypothetical protein